MFGIKIRDAAGNITFDTSYRTLRTVNSVYLPANTSGSLDVSSYGTLGNYFLIAVDVPTSNPFLPFLTLSGNTMTWENNGDKGTTAGCYLVFGLSS